MRPSGFRESQDTKRMEPSPDLQFGTAVRAAEAWLPAQLPQVSITDVWAWIWSCIGKAAAGAAALMQSMSQHHWRDECKISLCQKHYRENICSSCPCCPAAVPQGGHCRRLAWQTVMAVTYWEGPPTKSRGGKDLSCGSRRGRHEWLQEIQHPGWVGSWAGWL